VGAALLVPLPTWWTPRGTKSFTATIQYLTSWSQMGILEISCLGPCHCETHALDALRIASDGSANVTVFAEHSFDVSLEPAANTSTDHVKRGACEVLMRVLDRTSTSGLHFKLRDVLLTVNTSSPCQLHNTSWKFLKARSGLTCGK
jgi:hypothetical protein